MTRPLGTVAICYTGGLLLAHFFHPPLWLLFSASFITALAAIVWARGRSWVLWPLVALAGWTNLESRTAVISPYDLRTIESGVASDLVTVRGTLIETPQERTIIRDERESSHTLARVELSAIQRSTDWQAAFGKLMVLSPGLLPTNYFAGQQVEIRGALSPPPGPVADGLFDYGDYLRQRGIYFELRTKRPDDWVLLAPALTTRPLTDRFLGWARATLGRDLPAQDEPLELIWSMTLRWKTTLDGRVYEPFVNSGTMHVFAVSGLHIALIAGFLIGVLRLVRVPRAWAGLVVIPLIWFYTAATGWESSAVRATVMMTIVIAGWSLRQPGNLLNSLAAAALVILLWDPEQLFQSGFQLSFFVMLSMAIVLPLLQERFAQWSEPDPFLPAELVPRWRRAIQWLVRRALGLLALSVAAWLGSLPLTAYYFHLICPVSVLANLIAVPLSSAALACNLGSLLCGVWFPWATALFNHSAWFWMRGVIIVSEWASSLPGAFWYVRAPSLASVAIYYLLLVGLLSGWLLVPQRRRWTVAAMALLGTFYLWGSFREMNCTEITVLPLMGGSGVFVNAPGVGNDLLADTGSTNAVVAIVEPFLQAQGVNRLTHLALTHENVRQSGGLELLCSQVRVGEVDASSFNFRSPIFPRIRQWFEKYPERRVLNRGDVLAGWTVLHPDGTNRYSTGDSGSLVLRSEVRGVRILLLSDLGKAGQASLLERNEDLRADIVVAGLPDKDQPLGDPLLDAIQPGVIIIADSELPANRLASSWLEQRLAGRKVPVVYTHSARAVTIVCDGSRWLIRTMDGQRISGVEHRTSRP